MFSLQIPFSAPRATRLNFLDSGEFSFIFSRVSSKTLEKNLAVINARPKKILNFQKPQDLFELFLEKCCTSFDKSPLNKQNFFMNSKP